jgi:hypothetical protein
MINKHFTGDVICLQGKQKKKKRAQTDFAVYEKTGLIINWAFQETHAWF